MLSIATMLFLAAAPDAGTRTESVITWSVKVGKRTPVEMPCTIQRIAMSNAPWDVRPSADGGFELIGFGEGRGTFIGWCTDGQRVDRRIEVTK